MSDWIRQVEAIYQIEEPSHERWIASVGEVVGRSLGGATQICSIFHVDEKHGLRMLTPTSSAAELVTSGQQMSMEDPRLMLRAYRGEPIGSFRSVDRSMHRGNKSTTLQRVLAGLGFRDVHTLVARDGGSWGASVAAFVAFGNKTQIGDLAPLREIAAHVHAALRLRFRLHGKPHLHLGGAAKSVGLSLGVDAILSPTGDVKHAEGDAVDHRQELRHAARLIDKARAKQRREDPEGALNAWRAMVAGEWSLVETFESDGRRVMVARRNRPDALGAPLLTEREAVVLGFRARAHSIKLIAYELGLSQASISRTLSIGLAKLGMKSPLELVRLSRRPRGTVNE